VSLVGQKDGMERCFVMEKRRWSSSLEVWKRLEREN
jgi:hypothetical protein